MRLSNASLHVLGLAGSALLITACDGRAARPEAFWLLWLLPALALFYVVAFRRAADHLLRFAAPAMLLRISSDVACGRKWLRAALIVLAALALVLTLADLQYGFTWEEIQRRGVDIVIALDVSDSMLVEDAEPGGSLSRLERAKREITDLLQLLNGDRIALVAFAGTGFVECPLTLDYGAAAIFLSAIDTDLIPVKGTSLSEALTVSLDALEGGVEGSKAVILMTDGEDHSPRLSEAVERARREGVRIFPIGIGRDEGAPIPEADGGFRRDRQGEIVLSRLDEPTLQRMALDTGGRYVRSVTGDVDLEQVYTLGIKATLEDRELESKRHRNWHERFQWPLSVATICLMLEPLIPERRRRREVGDA